MAHPGGSAERAPCSRPTTFTQRHDPRRFQWSYGRTRAPRRLLMRSVTYSMSVSLDGDIVGPDGAFDWTTPDAEVFRFWIDELRQVGVHLLGRRLYETMLYWETAEQEQPLDETELEWAAIWRPLPKVVFSTTLSAVQGDARLVSGGLAEELERLRAEPGEDDIANSGAGLAAGAAAAGLVDEYRAMVYPVRHDAFQRDGSRASPRSRRAPGCGAGRCARACPAAPLASGPPSRALRRRRASGVGFGRSA
jgi:dihydrofolate reductase